MSFGEVSCLQLNLITARHESGGEKKAENEILPCSLIDLTHLMLLKLVEQANIQNARQLHHHKANHIKQKALTVFEAKRGLLGR